MSTNFVHAARRLTFTAAVAHTAGDLVYHKGFYGVVQDDIAAGAVGTLILEGAWALPRVASTLPMGTVVAAPATELATSLPMGSVATMGVVATTGWNPVGRVIATGNATVAKIQLFNPNQGFAIVG